MKISSVMSGNVQVLDANATVREAAQKMLDEDIGSVPVSENDKLVGMVTDRDIVLRVVAEAKPLETSLREIMSEGVKYCYEDDDVQDIARNMAELGVRRLPVIDRNKRLVGFVSLANINSAGNPHATEKLLDGTAQPH